MILPVCLLDPLFFNDQLVCWQPRPTTALGRSSFSSFSPTPLHISREAAPKARPTRPESGNGRDGGGGKPVGHERFSKSLCIIWFLVFLGVHCTGCFLWKTVCADIKWSMFKFDMSTQRPGRIESTELKDSAKRRNMTTYFRGALCCTHFIKFFAQLESESGHKQPTRPPIVASCACSPLQP